MAAAPPDSRPILVSVTGSSRLLLRDALLDGPQGTAVHDVLIEGDRIVAITIPGEDPRAEAVLELDGALVTAGFVDAHVHLVQTGMQLGGLDLTGCVTRAEMLDRVAAHVLTVPRGRTVLGSGWDETLWPDPTLPTAEELERAAPGRALLLSRIDGHSALASPGLLALVPQAADEEGCSPDGRLERAAKQVVTTALAGLVGSEERLDAARVAARRMAELGIVAFHEAAAPHIGPDYELALVQQAAAEVGLVATCYWGAHLAFEALDRLPVLGLAGDLNADGAIGSRTAALRTAYADAPGHLGHAFLDAEEIADHIVGCTERGVQAGFHCIGEAALDAIGAGFALAEERLGAAALRAARHRLEHVQMASPQVIDVLARCGVVASVQPMFDALWGGPEAMYAERLGERWSQVNRFADLAAAGVPLAFGSDAPVTPLGPWEAVLAAADHRTPGQSLTVRQAVEAHTRGGWRAARVDDAGTVSVGRRACVAVWDTERLPEVGARPPTARMTIVDGQVVHRTD